MFFLLALIVNAQTIKTYTGGIESPKKIPLSEGKCQITYNYYQGDNTRIWHGKFSLKKVEDKFTGWHNGTITGSFQNGEKTGTWKFTERNAMHANTHNKNIIVNFKEDKLDGQFRIITDWVELNGLFVDDHLVDTLYIIFRDKKYVKATRPAKYIYSEKAYARLIFDRNGLADGCWIFTNKSKSERFDYFFKSGVLNLSRKYDDSTGETTVTYKNPQSNSYDFNNNSFDIKRVESLGGRFPYATPWNNSDLFEQDSEGLLRDLINLLNEVNIMNGKNEDSWLPFAKYTMKQSYGSSERIDNGDDTILDEADEMPSFPGGPAALQLYLNNNVIYPSEAAENGVEGRVIVSFVVEKDGSISNVTVARSADASLDKEAVRVVKSMPKWTPGKQDGKLVRVKYTAPLTFRLQ